MTIDDIKNEIKRLADENTKLYYTFQYSLWKDSAQPVIKQWRENARKIRELKESLNKTVDCQRLERQKDKITTTAAEKSPRYITTATYERAIKRTAKEVMLFMGEKI